MWASGMLHMPLWAADCTIFCISGRRENANHPAGLFVVLSIGISGRSSFPAGEVTALKRYQISSKTGRALLDLSRSRRNNHI